MVYYGESEEAKAEDNSMLEQTIILQDLGNAIFNAADFDDDDIDFSYQPDFDSFFDNSRHSHSVDISD